MLLAEAIREKEYLEESISNLKDSIKNIILFYDKKDVDFSKKITESKIEELKDLYTKYQQFCISVERGMSSTSIKVNETKLTLLDAVTINEVMENKLSVFESLLSDVSKVRDIDEVTKLFSEVDQMRLDIKTLGNEIEYAFWNVEVS